MSVIVDNSTSLTCDLYKEKLLSIVGDSDVNVFHNYRSWDLSRIFEHMKETGYDLTNKDVLDTGALHTYSCIYYASIARSVTATDSFYWASRSYCKEQNLVTPEAWMRFVGSYGVLTDGLDLEEIDDKYYNQFDVVFCVSTIEHVINDFKGMIEISKVLRPNGRVYFTTEFCSHMTKPYSEDDGSFYRIYDEESLRSLIRYSGLKLISDIIVSGELNSNDVLTAFFCLEKL